MVDGEHRVRVEVVAEPHVAVPVRAGVAGAPVDEVEVGVVGAGDPARRAAGAPRLAGPGLVVGMVGAGNGPRAPREVAGRRVVGVDEAADAELAAGDARHDLALDDEGRGGLAVARAVVGDLAVPHQVAGARVDGHEVRVEGAHVEGVAEDGHPAVVPPAADAQVVGQGVVVAPVLAPGGGVDGDDVARRLGDEHHPVDHQRRRLGPVELRDLVGPLQLEPADVAVVDLVEPAVALGVEGARVHQPVLGLVGRVQQALPGDGREGRRRTRRVVGGLGGRGGGEGEQGEGGGKPLHGVLPVSVVLSSGRGAHRGCEPWAANRRKIVKISRERESRKRGSSTDRRHRSERRVAAVGLRRHAPNRSTGRSVDRPTVLAGL